MCGSEAQASGLVPQGDHAVGRVRRDIGAFQHPVREPANPFGGKKADPEIHLGVTGFELPGFAFDPAAGNGEHPAGASFPERGAFGEDFASFVARRGDEPAGVHDDDRCVGGVRAQDHVAFHEFAQQVLGVHLVLRTPETDDGDETTGGTGGTGGLTTHLARPTFLPILRASGGLRGPGFPCSCRRVLPRP